MGVDILGFSIYSKREDTISPESFQEITEWIAGVDFAGEFHGASIEDVKQALKTYPISYIEISDSSLVESINLLGKSIIFVVNIKTENDLRSLRSKFSYLDELVSIVTIRCENQEFYKTLDEQISYYNGNLRLLKGYNVNTKEDLTLYPGLELQATLEEKPGFKDYGELMDVLEVIED